MLKKVILLVTAFIGAVLSVYAAILTVAVRNDYVFFKNWCSVNSVFDCNTVAASEASLFLGVPVALLAFTYYVWIFAAVVWTFSSAINERQILTAAFVISVLAAAGTLYKAFQMIFQLQVVCLVCLSMYVANAAILLLLFLLLRLKARLSFHTPFAKLRLLNKDKLEFLVPNYLPTFLSFIIVFLSAFFIIKISPSNNILRKQLISNTLSITDKYEANALQKHFSQTKLTIHLAPDAPAFGNSKAKVAIIEFSDFECPFCRSAALQVKKLVARFKDKVQLYFIHYPLDKSINRYVKSQIHQHAGLAARAAIYASDQGKFWEFHDAVFNNQNDLSNKIFVLAKKYGWNMKQFNSAVESTDIVERVKKHIECGQEVKIQGTPTIYINGRKVEEWENFSVLQKIIKHELNS